MHLPLQSGCDSVLKRMARRCKTAEFADLVQQARLKVPHFNVTTDVIVGFPGETEAEWAESIAFIEKIGFGHIHIFSYSPRTGTAAAEFPHQINAEVKKQRSQQLHALAAQLKQQFISENLASDAQVLWEGQTEIRDNGQTRYFGYTGNYLRVACDVANEQVLENQILPVRLISHETDYIYGALIN